MTEQKINALGGKLFIIKKPSEDIIGTAFLILKQQGILEKVWYINPNIKLSEVLAWAKIPNNIIYAGFFQKDGDETPQLCGLGWINETFALSPTEKRGEVGMAFIKEWQRDDIPLELCQMMIEDGFVNEGLVVVFGTTPVKNPMAIRFVRKIGLREVGTAPRFVSWKGEPCDALISCVTKEEWFNQKPCPNPDTEAV